MKKDERLRTIYETIAPHITRNKSSWRFEAQFIELITDSVTYYIGKRCYLSDDEMPVGNGMATISHFNTLPLVGRLGTAVSSISKNILLEMERTIRIINKEKTENNEKVIGGTDLYRERRSNAPGHSNFQRQEEQSVPR